MGIQENMSKSIRSLKEVQHKSLVELSEELEISRSTLQKYLDGHGNPSLKMVEHLAEKLHVDPIFLLTEMFEPSQQEVVLLLMDTIRNLPSYRSQNGFSLPNGSWKSYTFGTMIHKAEGRIDQKPAFSFQWRPEKCSSFSQAPSTPSIRSARARRIGNTRAFVAAAGSGRMGAVLNARRFP